MPTIRSLAVPAVLVLMVSSCNVTTGEPHQATPTIMPKPATPVQQHHEARPASYEAALAAIAQDIERLKSDYVQLADFSGRKHCDRRRLVISYGYRTHEPEHRGGWSSGVPSPDPDGIWFYVDFHDPDSQAQIHTQPMVPDMRYREKKVMLLILEGQRTRRFAPALGEILRSRGVTLPEALAQ
jgi:hypothetical protein